MSGLKTLMTIFVISFMMNVLHIVDMLEGIENGGVVPYSETYMDIV